MLARAPVLLAALTLAFAARAALARAPTAAVRPIALAAARTAPAAATASTPAPTPLPDLLPLAQKMEGLQASSERFRLRILVSASGAHVSPELRAFLKAFEIDLSGEVSSSPLAGVFKLTILGRSFAVRVVHGTAYMYEPSIAKRDKGRPWIDLGAHSASALLGGSGIFKVPLGAGVTSFKRLAVALGHARGVTELGPGTVDGQAVTGFRARVDPAALEELAPPERPSKPKGIFAPIGIGSSVKEAPPPSALLEVFIAPSGLPVRTRIVQREEEVTTSALFDIFAINFPLTVEPPPKDLTIDRATLRKLALKQHGKRSKARGERERDPAGK